MKPEIRVHFAFLGIIAILLSSSLEVFAQEEEISPKDLPAAVLTAFKNAYPNATIKGASKEIEKGQTFYEIESVDGKIKRDVLYLPDGKLAEIEESLAASDLPATIRQSLNSKYPDGEIEKAEKLMRNSSIQYEVVIESGEENYEFVLDANGKILKTEKSGQEKGKEEKKEQEEKR